MPSFLGQRSGFFNPLTFSEHRLWTSPGRVNAIQPNLQRGTVNKYLDRVAVGDADDAAGEYWQPIPDKYE